MKRILRGSIVACLLAATVAAAHVSPMVQLVQKGTFIRSALRGASQFFEHELGRGAVALNRLAADMKWQPSAEEIKVYVGRDAQSRLVGSVVFLRVPSEHGPVGVGVAFDAEGHIAQATVTEVGSEPLAWVRPLLDAGALKSVRGLAAASQVDAATLAPQVQGRMSRYYAGVIAEGIERAGVVVEAEQLTNGAGST